MPPAGLHPGPYRATLPSLMRLAPSTLPSAFAFHAHHAHEENVLFIASASPARDAMTNRCGCGWARRCGRVGCGREGEACPVVVCPSRRAGGVAGGKSSPAPPAGRGATTAAATSSRPWAGGRATRRVLFHFIFPSERGPSLRAAPPPDYVSVSLCHRHRHARAHGHATRRRVLGRPALAGPCMAVAIARNPHRETRAPRQLAPAATTQGDPAPPPSPPPPRCLPA